MTPLNPFRKLVPGTIVYVRACIDFIDTGPGDAVGIPPIAVIPCDVNGKAWPESGTYYFEEKEIITKGEAVAELRKALR